MIASASVPGGYDGFIVDLDGVAWLGGQPIEGSPQALAKLRADGVGLVFLTNDPQGPRGARGPPTRRDGRR